MEQKRFWCLLLALSFPFFSSFPSGRSSNDVSAVTRSLDSTIRDRAFEALIQRRRTGVAYSVPLPANLSAMEASVIRLRSRSFWRWGANLSTSHIPPRILPVPYARRVVVVYQDWGGMSASFFGVPGFELASPVVGLFLYDASSGTSSSAIVELGLRVTGDPISIRFPTTAALPKGSNSTMKCARFGRNGSVQLENMAAASGLCTTTSTGHFAVVVVPSAREGKEKRWRILIAEITCGILALVLVVMIGMGMLNLVRKRKMNQIVRHADENGALETVWVGKSRMPSATMTRTQPYIENEDAP